ncbi:glycoside hydrolase family 2 protein [Lyophyllum atratum]|nr:glycoside hydrolase family 2 protein [Lyophyllum atratum]
MYSSTFASLLSLSIISSVSGAIFDLSELQWTLKNKNGSIQIPASGPPSQAHLDLANAGVITEPLLGINDFTQRWIIDDDWTYTADLSPFSRTLNATAEQTTLLVFYGIDTVANISVAGHPVAWVNNQFRQYTFDVSASVASPSSDDNNVTVSLQSAYHYALNVSTRPDAEHFPGNGGFEYPGIFPWVRKVASDFGWDWGPAFVPVGIYKRAYLVTLSSNTNVSTIQTGTPPISPSDPASVNDVAGPIFVDESSIDIYKTGQSFSVPPKQNADWIVNVTLALRSAAAIPKSILTLAFPELNIRSKPFDISNIPISTNESFWVTATWSIPDSVPQRWYPHNLGTPQLYNLTVVLGTPASDNASSNSLVNFVTRTGFRTIELAQAPYSKEDVGRRGIIPGDQWHFKINGKAFYSLGTNIIPFDPFYARMTTDHVRWVLESAVKSGQNMLRVWGGGTYQPSSSSVAGGGYDFYSICDEIGILAWSELIFSDALYPINDFLLETIESEVRQNVRRVNRHPSNVQWAGGNEIEGIVTSTNRSVENGIHFLNEFVTLFQHFLHDIVVSETHSVPYTDCSTTKGVLSLDPYVLRFDNGTQGNIYGNAERYNYDASVAFDYSTFPVSRFMNEFGFHSMPSFYSWEEVLTSPEDFSFNSTVVMSREHHPPAGSLAFPNPNAPEGQRELTVAVELWLPTPGTTDTNQTFAQWCYSTQVFQTMTMVSQVAWYRHGAGQGENNLGALVWQLNDIWQGVSWSSIEYSGRWKVLQYGLTGIFSPITIFPFWTAANETLRTLVISDRLEEVQGSAQLTWYDWLGKPLNTTLFNFTVPTLNNSLISQASGLNKILPAGKEAADVWLLLNATADIDGRKVTNEQYFTPTSLANAHLVDPEISVTRSQDLTFTLSAKGGVAPWTWLDHPAGTIGVFVDKETGLPSNGFYLIPGIDRTVSFLLNPALSRVAAPSPADFVVRSLWNNTHI